MCTYKPFANHIGRVWFVKLIPRAFLLATFILLISPFLKGTKCPSNSSCSICRDANFGGFLYFFIAEGFIKSLWQRQGGFLRGFAQQQLILFTGIFVSATKSSEPQQKKSVIPKQTFAAHLLKSPIVIDAILDTQFKFESLLTSCCLANALQFRIGMHLWHHFEIEARYIPFTHHITITYQEYITDKSTQPRILTRITAFF